MHKRPHIKSFDKARMYARTLGFETSTEWIAWARTKKRPRDIPYNPAQFYRNEWKGWIYWLGSTSTANKNRTFRSFQKARIFARSLGLPNRRAWRRWSKNHERPSDIPARPELKYKGKGWISWADWLGTHVGEQPHMGKEQRDHSNQIEFAEARAFASSLHLNSASDWYAWIKTGAKPVNIPENPYVAYKGKGWTSWGDWLGKESKQSAPVSQEGPASKEEVHNPKDQNDPEPQPDYEDQRAAEDQHDPEDQRDPENQNDLEDQRLVEELRLGRLVDPLQAAVLCMLSAGLYWFIWYRRLHKEIVFHLEGSDEVESRDVTCLIPIWHLYKSYLLAQLILKMEKQNHYAVTSPLLAGALALFPPFAIFYLQTAVNYHWWLHKRYAKAHERG